MRSDILIKCILIVVLITTSVVTAEYSNEEVDTVQTIIYEAGKEIKPGFTENLIWYVGDEYHSGTVGFWQNGQLTSEMKNADYWDINDPDIVMSGEMTDQLGASVSYISFIAPTPFGDIAYVTIDGYSVPLSEIKPVADNIFNHLVEESVASGVLSGDKNPEEASSTEYTEQEIYDKVTDAIREIRPGLTDEGYWYAGDDQHVGIIYYSEVALKPEMTDPAYWDINQRMTIYETPEMVVSSSIVFDAPTPYGTRVFVTVDGYNVPVSEIKPVAEVAYNTFIQASVESGVIGEVVTGDTEIEEYDLLGDTVSEDEQEIDDFSADSMTPVSTNYDDGYTDDSDIEETLAEIDELFSLYDKLLNEGLVEYEGELDVEDIDKQDIEDIQNIQMNYAFSEEFVESMQQEAVIIDMLRDETSADIDMLDEIDTSQEQDVDANMEIIREVFEDDFIFEGDSSVRVGSGPEYEGKEKVAEKLTDTIYLDAFDKTRKESMEKLKTGHEAASFFVDGYGDSKIAKNFEKMDNINSIKEKVDTYYGAYKDTKKLSEMKGASGTAAKALYVAVKSGQEVADKIPVVGSLIKTGFEVAEKTVMIMPELDNAIKNSDQRQGIITNGPIGTSTPNAFLSSYGKVTQTSDGPLYTLPYTDENGEEHEINPDQWVKITSETGTYYIPTDEWENPIGDIALKDSGSSWKPWKWDNCQVVKRSNPKILYNNGEEYDL